MKPPTNATGKRQANIRYPLGWQKLEDLRVVLIVLRGQSAESSEHQVSRSLGLSPRTPSERCQAGPIEHERLGHVSF